MFRKWIQCSCTIQCIEADNGEESRTLDVPRDHSGSNNAGFKLPLPDEGTNLVYAKKRAIWLTFKHTKC